MKNILQINLDETEKLLISEAIEIRKKAYCPYSNYKVGAALLDINGIIHTGCNIESADYTLTSHAEMVAVDSMVKSGCLQILKVAIALRGINDLPATPCGLCRQKLSEFDKTGESSILVANLNSEDEITNIYQFSLKELLPHTFSSIFI
jgi:cytidine deaminase